MIKKYNQYIKENNIVYNQDDVDPYGEEIWDYDDLTTVLRIAKRQGKPYDQITILDCHGNGLKDLEGVEKLINLETLICYDNNLKKLNEIENLTNLESLYCWNNELENLGGIKNLINLRLLDCFGNYLTNIDEIKNLSSLITINCSYNNFSLEYKKYLKDYCFEHGIGLYI